ncbi:glycosyltransferase [Candidatus Microgenomates bacterium]|jgi:glycosyltransferase involved in cell wall biosynthesis|nr:MAG: glycosyltransferase [Candidatus Microgenomates bacterium]
MKKPKASVIIPVRTITPYVRETVDHLLRQTEKNFEIIVVTDKKEELKGVMVIASGQPTPSFKRNLGAKKAKGEILAFLDDDSYPCKDWLKNALRIFNDRSLSDHRPLTAVCGPTLTPPHDNIFQKASGCVWSSFLGSGGAGVYRNRVKERREVDDFPSVNLLVKKKDFEKVSGFDINHWPGEDTKLCLDLTSLGKKIIYDPGVLVYHHRRAVIVPHLKQISRYALRRGHFAKIFPKTSLRIGYLLPSFLAYGLLFGLGAILLFPFLAFFYLSFLAIYFIALFLTGLEVQIREKDLRITILTIISIFLTHLVYGFLFPIGFLQKELKTVAHQVDEKRKVYIGG